MTRPGLLDKAKLRLEVEVRLQVPALISLAQVKRETGARFFRNSCAAPATVSDAGVSASHCEKSWEGDTLNLASPDTGLETRFGNTAGGGIRVPS